MFADFFTAGIGGAGGADERTGLGGGKGGSDGGLLSVAFAADTVASGEGERAVARGGVGNGGADGAAATEAVGRGGSGGGANVDGATLREIGLAETVGGSGGRDEDGGGGGTGARFVTVIVISTTSSTCASGNWVNEKTPREITSDVFAKGPMTFPVPNSFLKY